MFLEWEHWAQVDFFCLVVFFQSKSKQKNPKYATVSWMVPCTLHPHSCFFSCPLLFSLCFFFHFFLLNNFFVEWAGPGERPGDEKMGPVRNPGQWRNLPEPLGGSAAGKRWWQIPCQTTVLEFSLLRPPKVSQNFTYRDLQVAGCKGVPVTPPVESERLKQRTGYGTTRELLVW